MNELELGNSSHAAAFSTFFVIFGIQSASINLERHLVRLALRTLFVTSRFCGSFVIVGCILVSFDLANRLSFAESKSRAGLYSITSTFCVAELPGKRVLNEARKD